MELLVLRIWIGLDWIRDEVGRMDDSEVPLEV